MKACPRCGLDSPPDATRCDCGYDFKTGRREQSYDAGHRDLADRRARWGHPAVWLILSIFPGIGLAMGAWAMVLGAWMNPLWPAISLACLAILVFCLMRFDSTRG